MSTKTSEISITSPEEVEFDASRSCRNVRTKHKGWLYKRTHGFLFKKWDKRYFVLDRIEKQLVWYRRKVDEESGEKPACVVPLHDQMNVILDVPENQVKRRNVFKIEDPCRKNSRKRKEFYLSVDEEFKRFSWVTQLWDLIDLDGERSKELGLTITFNAKRKDGTWSTNETPVLLPWVVYLSVRPADKDACHETRIEMNRALRKAGIEKTTHRMSITSVLRLLGQDVRNCDVRRRAVSELKHFDDTMLSMYLLQFVQAVRYDISNDSETLPPLANALIERATRSLALANSLRWHLQVESEVSKPDEIVDIDEILDQFNDLGYEIALTGDATDIFDGMIEEHGNPAHVWRCQKKRFEMMLAAFWKCLEESKNEDTRRIGLMLLKQQSFVKQLNEVWSRATSSKKREKVQAKKVRLRQILSKGIVDADDVTLSYNTAIPSLKDFDMSHPLDTSVTFRRLVPHGCSLFRSAQIPMLVTCTNGIISVAPKVVRSKTMEPSSKHVSSSTNKETEEKKDEDGDEDVVSRSMSEPPPRIPVSTSDFVKGKIDDVVVSTGPVRTPERREIIITLLNVQNVERLINISKNKKIGKVYVTTECGRREEMTKQIDVNKIDVDRGGIAWNVTFEMTFSNIGPENPPPRDMYLTLYGVETHSPSELKKSSSLKKKKERRRSSTSSQQKVQRRRRLSSRVESIKERPELDDFKPQSVFVLSRVRVNLNSLWDKPTQHLKVFLPNVSKGEDESLLSPSVGFDSEEKRTCFPEYRDAKSADEAALEIDLEAAIHKYTRRSTQFDLVWDEEEEKKESYGFIFKSGDDVRQDVLIMQLITLMDGWLKNRGFDAMLSPYRVLATGVDTGMIELVKNSTTLSTVLEEHGSILQFFKNNGATSPTEALGVRMSVLNTFVHSCAGYSVVTYLLGLGDRHFDNLMLKPSGHFFHIDFGWAFGQDPKPYPSKMRLNKDIIDGMGGVKSPWYGLFEKLCCDAFLILRDHVRDICVLLDLMSQAGIHHMGIGDDAADVIEVVRGNFLPHLSDEDASDALKEIIVASIGAVMPEVMEYFHKVAVSFK